MDTSEYMPMFLAEAREHLQELNLAVVQLEDNPSDRPTVDQIFRIAHSLKGMSATMGFSAIAKLTHEMEEVFELLRQRAGGLGHDVVDAVLACLDALSEAVESIEAVGSEKLDPEPLIERLRHLVRHSAEEVPLAPVLATSEAVAVTAARDAGARVLHVVATLDDEVQMPAVRAHMVLAALVDHGELIANTPATEAIDSFSGRRVEAWLASDQDEDQVARSTTRVSDVASVTVTDVTSASPQASAAGVDAAQVDAAPATAAEADVEAATGAPAPAAPGRGGMQAATGASHSARTVRVDAERLDALMHLMGELVIHRTAVEALTANIERPELHHAVQNLTRSSQSLQSMVMQVRMIPVDVVFMRFPRLVRDLSTKLGKNVELQLLGRETELDRTVVDALGDPLVHLVRNSLDHGLEPPEERVAAGKEPVGTLTIAARHAGGSVVIEVRDNGHGINPAVVGRKAAEKGLIDADQAATLDMKGAIELLFAPGFSTAETTSDISGRGVGMDAVRAKIRELGGEVLLDSTQGLGTCAQIRLPLTLAIVSALQIDVSGAPFAIPIDRIERTVRLGEHSVSSVAGRRVLVLEDGVLPLLEGAAVFGRELVTDHELVVIVRGDDRRIGLAVDELVGQRELVTRPLPPIVAEGQPVSGGAVLADGQIALIVDCDALAAGVNIAEKAMTLQTQLAAA
jgi:two-component system, chemotaxis family, sensor kinase CheA